MKIAHVSALPSKGGRGPVGGVGTYTVALLQLLESTGFESVVLCNADAATSPPAANAIAIPTWRFGDPFYPRAICAEIERVVPDVVHLQQELFLYGPGPRALLFPLLLKKLVRKRRVVVTVHGVTTDREIDASLMQGRRSIVPLAMLRAVIVGIFRAIARSGAHLIVHGEVLKQRLVELGARAERVTVIPHPLFEAPTQSQQLSQSQARAALGLPAGAKIALTWGYWNGYKGLEELARGFSIFRRERPEATLILGTGPHPQLRGDRAYMASYDAAMRALANDEGIVHAGFIDDAALPQYVRAADVCVFAYTKYLASSGPATFALTLGTPVLLSSVFPEAPPRIAFEPSPSGVAGALERFFADPQTHALAARQLADEASEERLRQRYEALYRGLVE